MTGNGAILALGSRSPTAYIVGVGYSFALVSP